ncbi:MAG: ATP-binding domain-containing protein, partial [Lachnospiraceae bacterium]|nr:ATP-binding domain-containing protein [Lachnospiraceae bacterium]
IGSTTVTKCLDNATAHDMSLLDAYCVAREIPGLSKATAEKIHGFVDVIFRFRSLAAGLAVDELIGELLDDIHYEEELDKLTLEEQEAKSENIDELISKAADFDRDADDPTLSAFLEEVALVADIDSVGEDDERLLLMTLHGAKGLEFDHVYLAGMEDGLFPSSMSINSGLAKDIEEERRLCYVGITRARKTLTLTMAKVRMLRGETMFCIPSRFIREIEDGMLVVEGQAPARRQTFDDDWGGNFRNRYRDTDDEPVRRSVPETPVRDPAFSATRAAKAYTKPKLGSLGYGSPKPPAFGKSVPSVKADHLDFTVGDRVHQARFGNGTVLEITEMPTDYKVRVQFDEEASPKVMLAGFAQFEKIED